MMVPHQKINRMLAYIEFKLTNIIPQQGFPLWRYLLYSTFWWPFWTSCSHQYFLDWWANDSIHFWGSKRLNCKIYRPSCDRVSIDVFCLLSIRLSASNLNLNISFFAEVRALFLHVASFASICSNSVLYNLPFLDSNFIIKLCWVSDTSSRDRWRHTPPLITLHKNTAGCFWCHMTSIFGAKTDAECHFSGGTQSGIHSDLRIPASLVSGVSCRILKQEDY